MNDILHDLLKVLALERLDDNLFRGESRDVGSDRVFGGQVLGQALTAASRTVEGRVVHSLHAYFLRAGDIDVPIVYEVDRGRDGRSFSNRRVVAIQHGRPILNMAASFQVPEEGLSHQDPMPEVPPPEALGEMGVFSYEQCQRMPDKLRRLLDHQRPFQFRSVESIDVMNPGRREPRRHIWFRTVDRLPDDDHLHRGVLAYVSDYNLLPTATMPHGLSLLQRNLQMASLDHAMWFHRAARVDDWLLYVCESPSASGARAFAVGRIYDRAGALIASTAQEGVVRLWAKEPGE